MATTQQLLDLKYGRQLLEDRARLSELFSEDIIGALANQNRFTFEDIMQCDIIDLSYQRGLLTSFKGIQYLKNLTVIAASNSVAGEINLSSLNKLVSIQFNYCYDLENIGSLINLHDLAELSIYETKISNVGSLRFAAGLIVIDARNTLLEQIDLNFTSLRYVYLSGCNFSTIQVDKILSDAKFAKQGGSPLESLNLGGATMGIPTNGAANADYVWLINNGVTVTIRTA